MIVTIVVAVLNFLGSLLPQLPTLYNELAGHDDLTPDGKNALELIAGDLDAADKRIQALKPLPLPDAQPSATSSEPSPTPPPPAPTVPAVPATVAPAAAAPPAPTPPAPTPPAATADPANEVA